MLSGDVRCSVWVIWANAPAALDATPDAHRARSGREVGEDIWSTFGDDLV